MITKSAHLIHEDKHWDSLLFLSVFGCTSYRLLITSIFCYLFLYLKKQPTQTTRNITYLIRCKNVGVEIEKWDSVLITMKGRNDVTE